jgi:hypothetical protein
MVATESDIVSGVHLEKARYAAKYGRCLSLPDPLISLRACSKRKDRIKASGSGKFYGNPS